MELGDDFLDEVERCLLSLPTAPRRFPLVEDGVEGVEIRESYLTRFRQRLIYMIDGETIVMLAVCDARRRPGRRHGRIQQPEE